MDTATTEIYTDTLFPYTTLFRSQFLRHVIPEDGAPGDGAPGARSGTPGKPSATAVDVKRGRAPDRSEEHTSELQSLMRISYAGLCLKKKKSLHKTQLIMK